MISLYRIVPRKILNDSKTPSPVSPKYKYENPSDQNLRCPIQ
ncbi:MAG: hypothetical protein ACMUEL_06115 [Flavobacteriales bacterium Tduv]